MLTQKKAWLFCFLIGSFPVAGVANAEVRSEKHQEYAATLWDYLQGQSYTGWAVAGDDLALDVGPPAGEGTKSYANKVAAGDPALPHGSLIVTEYIGEEDSPVGVTVCYRARDGFNACSNDWYWAHFLADGTVVKTVADRCPYSKRGFYTTVEDGRLWVFRLGTAELAEFINSGEPAKQVIRPVAGPGGMTVKSSDNDVITEYLATKCGFVVKVDDGRLWVFREGSEALADFVASGEPAKQVIRPAAGPNGMTIKSADTETINEYLTAKSGYVTKDVDGRVWIFREGSEALAEFQSTGEPAKHVIRPGAGPAGMTLKGSDTETVDAYIAAADGFVTAIDDGRIWAFTAGSPELAEFEASGEPAKHVIRPAAGPQGMTVKAPDTETLDAYLRALGL
jgi:hypothetical protein